ncbi:hypothetical protein M3J09_013048 [Ascochyta lentis]
MQSRGARLQGASQDHAVPKSQNTEITDSEDHTAPESCSTRITQPARLSSGTLIWKTKTVNRYHGLRLTRLLLGNRFF